MGLLGRKVKQRIPQDPRNLSWADDASRFGSAYLSRLGFDHTDKNATLGVSGTGLTKHLKVHHKLDMLGVGAQHTKDPNGIAWKQNRDFENLLERLNANSEDPTEGEADSSLIDGFHPARINESVVEAVTAGSEKERKGKKKKRQRGDNEIGKAEVGRTKKRKKVESTTVASASEPAEPGPSSSNSPTPGITATPSEPHRHGRAHRARFIASKRLAAASSVAVAEILGIPSSSATPPSASGVTTPEVTPQVEDDEHKHLTVSSKTVTEYFKEKMRVVAPEPSSLETKTDEALRGGIGSRLGFWGHDEVEEGRGLYSGFGMGLLAKMSSAEAVTENLPQRETSGRREKKKKKRRSEDSEGDVNRKPKKKGKNHTLVASD